MSKAFVSSRLRGCLFLLAVFVFASKAVAVTTIKREPQKAVAVKVSALSRVARFDVDSTLPIAIQIDFSVGKQVRSVEVRRDSAAIVDRLMFAVFDLKSHVQTRAQHLAVENALDTLVVNLVSKAGVESIAPKDRTAIARKLRTAVAEIKKVLGEGTKNGEPVRPAFLQLAQLVDEFEYGTSTTQSPAEMPEDIRQNLKFLEFIERGHELFSVLADRMTYEEKARWLAPVNTSFNEVVTLLRGGRTEREVQSALNQLIRAIETYEAEISDFVSTPEFHTTGPQLRDWIHEFAKSLGRKATFKLKSVQADGPVAKAPTITTFTLREIPALARMYLDFIESRGGQRTLGPALTAAHRAIDNVVARLSVREDGKDLPKPALQKDLVVLTIKLRAFDAELNRLKKTAQDQHQAMQYAIWLARLQLMVTGSSEVVSE